MEFASPQLTTLQGGNGRSRLWSDAGAVPVRGESSATLPPSLQHGMRAASSSYLRRFATLHKVDLHVPVPRASRGMPRGPFASLLSRFHRGSVLAGRIPFLPH